MHKRQLFYNKIALYCREINHLAQSFYELDYNKRYNNMFVECQMNKLTRWFNAFTELEDDIFPVEDLLTLIASIANNIKKWQRIDEYHQGMSFEIFCQLSRLSRDIKTGLIEICS